MRFFKHTKAALATAVYTTLAGCSSLEPVFIPEGTVVDSPTTIKVSVPRNVTLSIHATTEVRLPVLQIGAMSVYDSELVVLLQLDPIVQVTRAHAHRIELNSRHGRQAITVDGFLVDSSGIADLEVDCKPRRGAARTNCDEAMLKRRDDRLEMIFLQPIELGGTTVTGLASAG